MMKAPNFDKIFIFEIFGKIVANPQQNQKCWNRE